MPRTIGPCSSFAKGATDEFVRPCLGQRSRGSDLRGGRQIGRCAVSDEECWASARTVRATAVRSDDVSANAVRARQRSGIVILGEDGALMGPGCQRGEIPEMIATVLPNAGLDGRARLERCRPAVRLGMRSSGDGGAGVGPMTVDDQVNGAQVFAGRDFDSRDQAAAMHRGTISGDRVLRALLIREPAPNLRQQDNARRKRSMAARSARSQALQGRHGGIRRQNRPRHLGHDGQGRSLP